MADRDIYTRPSTIGCEHPGQSWAKLRAMAGVWRGFGRRSTQTPDASGVRTSPFEETIELQPIDPQTNGPQLFYGLRYNSHMTKPGEIGTYHGQLGYWLWEPATGLILHSFTIPRGQVVLARGSRAAANASTFEVSATRGTTRDGICSSAFLEDAFRTDSFRMVITLNTGGGWSYFQDTILQICGRAEPFHHTDQNTLTLVSPPIPNPLAR